MARILVIDDEELIRYSIKGMLEEMGHTIDQAANGIEGTDLLKRREYDLIITDIVMPEKEGLETILEAREHNPNVKILAISGGGPIGRFDYLELAQQFGADAFIAKPFTADQLNKAVADLIVGA